MIAMNFGHKKIWFLVAFAALVVILGCAQRPQQPGQTNLAPVCGNNIIEAGESCKTCPADAACPLGQRCMAGACQSVSALEMCGNGKNDTDERLGIIENAETCCADAGCDDPLLECVANECAPKKCIDNTEYLKCATEKPLYCSAEGKLVDNCQDCGCPITYGCNPSGLCEKIHVNAPPNVSAGKNTTAEMGQRVTLEGVVTDDTRFVKTSWKQTSGPTVKLNRADSKTPYFFVTEPGIYEFTLTADDGEYQPSDSVKISAEVPKDKSVVVFAENYVIFVDKDFQTHKVPFSLKLPLVSDEPQKFEIDGKTFYYMTEVNTKTFKDGELVITAEGPDGAEIARIHYADHTTFNLSSKLPNYDVISNYVVLSDTEQNELWLVLEKTEFNLALDRTLYLLGTDLKEKGDVFSGYSNEFYVPKDDSFINYGYTSGFKEYNVAHFTIVEANKGITTVRVFIDTETNKLIETSVHLKNYKGSAEYRITDVARMQFSDGTANTFYGEQVTVDGSSALVVKKLGEETEGTRIPLPTLPQKT